MGEDKAGTRARFNAHLRDLIEPTIARHHGRIVKTTGDALLVELAIVVEAVKCAIYTDALQELAALSRPERDRTNSRPNARGRLAGLTPRGG